MEEDANDLHEQIKDALSSSSTDLTMWSALEEMEELVNGNSASVHTERPLELMVEAITTSSIFSEPEDLLEQLETVVTTLDANLPLERMDGATVTASTAIDAEIVLGPLQKSVTTDTIPFDTECLLENTDDVVTTLDTDLPLEPIEAAATSTTLVVEFPRAKTEKIAAISSIFSDAQSLQANIEEAVASNSTLSDTGPQEQLLVVYEMLKICNDEFILRMNERKDILEDIKTRELKCKEYPDTVRKRLEPYREAAALAGNDDLLEIMDRERDRGIHEAVVAYTSLHRTQVVQLEKMLSDVKKAMLVLWQSECQLEEVRDSLTAQLRDIVRGQLDHLTADADA